MLHKRKLCYVIGVIVVTSVVVVVLFFLKDKTDEVDQTARLSHSDGENPVVAAWQQVAGEKRIPAAVIDSVAGILRDGVEYRQIQPTLVQMTDLTNGLPGLVASMPFLKDPAYAEGAGYWLTFCVLEALTRPGPTRSSGMKSMDDYDALFTELREVFRKKILEQLPTEKREELTPVIDRGLQEWELRIRERTVALRKDFLFPALKNGLTQVSHEKVLTACAVEQRYPRYKEPEVLMQTRDEWYRRQLEDFFTEEFESVLFWICETDLRPRIKENPYWGHMGYQAHGVAGFWPIQMVLTVKTKRNEATGWKRK